MISPERLTALERQWVLLARDRSPSPDRLFVPFDELVKRHTEPHRHYHNLSHIAEVLRAAARLIPPGDDPATLLFAAWFHDSVYDPTRPDNEAKSAELMRGLLAEFTTERERDEIARLILLTRHDAEVRDPAGIALVDADLAILGASESRYQAYAVAIQREYAHVGDAGYCAGRGKVLAAFLARPSIYQHPVMVAEGEAAARANWRSSWQDCRDSEKRFQSSLVLGRGGRPHPPTHLTRGSFWA